MQKEILTGLQNSGTNKGYSLQPISDKNSLDRFNTVLKSALVPVKRIGKGGDE